MLFMVIERFKPGALEAVRTRFREKGRMLPDRVAYHGSWLEPSGARCFQLMEAPDADHLQGWIDRWSDLVELEINPVLTSAEFWSRWP
jgi:hypothetical protein